MRRAWEKGLVWACAAVMLCLLASPPAAADVASSLSGEINAVASYSELDEWTAKAPGSQRNSVGFEYFGKLSNDFGGLPDGRRAAAAVPRP